MARLDQMIFDVTLAEDYIRAYPSRLANASQSGILRGKKRNSDSIMMYATANFPLENTTIVQSAIRNGLKSLAIEEMNILPMEERACFICLVAIAHRSICRMSLEDLVEALKSLPEALKLVSNISPLMLTAYGV
jgi:hypothetical protein